MKSESLQCATKREVFHLKGARKLVIVIRILRKTHLLSCITALQYESDFRAWTRPVWDTQHVCMTDGSVNESHHGGYLGYYSFS